MFHSNIVTIKIGAKTLHKYSLQRRGHPMASVCTNNVIYRIISQMLTVKVGKTFQYHGSHLSSLPHLEMALLCRWVTASHKSFNKTASLTVHLNVWLCSMKSTSSTHFASQNTVAINFFVDCCSFGWGGVQVMKSILALSDHHQTP